MASQLLDWLTLSVRWLHLVAGAAWIGASFYFVWLNNTLREADDERDRAYGGKVAGELWAIHGGGFYRVMKYENAPDRLPKLLHWFKWEAYTTFLSGIGLLVLVYYANAQAYLIDEKHTALGPGLAVFVGISILVVGFGVYHTLSSSPLKHRPGALAIVGFLFFVVLCYATNRLLPPRAAYIHVGATLGTIMAANVFFVIIPNQRRAVAAMVQGAVPDASLGKDAALRSLHNNYLTLPVLLIMVSNHYPMAYGHEWGWLILVGLSVGGALIRHYFNLHGRGQSARWVLPTGGLVLALVVFFSLPPRAQGGGAAVPYAEVAPIFQARCVPCHADKPTHPSFTTPPLGLTLDTHQKVAASAAKIKATVVDGKTMPLGNLTQMTDAERQKVSAWIAGGASP